MGNKLSTVRRFRRGRCFINVGDVVRVKATQGRRNGFPARVRAIKVDPATGEVIEVEVFGGASGRQMVRTFAPDRIERVAQTRLGARKEVLR